MDKSINKRFFRVLDLPSKFLFFILLSSFSGCVMRDKWITVDCRVYEWTIYDEMRTSRLFYGVDSLVCGDSLVSVESAFVCVLLEGDPEKISEINPDSMYKRGFTDSIGFLHVFGAAPPGIYDIGIVVGKDRYKSVSIIAEDPPDSLGRHVISVVLTRE